MNSLCFLPSRFLLTALALGAAVVATASADPAKYRLNGGTSTPGEVARATSRMSLAGGDFTMTMGGQSMQGQMDMTNDTVKSGKIISVDDSGKPTVIELTYEKDTSSQKIKFGGQVMPHDEASPMQGVTVVRRRGENNLWTETLKEGTPTAKQKKRLHTNQPDDDDVLYPAAENAVGDTWTVPSGSLKRLFGDDVQKVDGTVRCKFLRVEDYAGESCAVIGIEMVASGTGTDDSSNAMKMTLNLHGTVYRSLKRALDLKTDMQGDLKIEGNIPAGAGTAAMTASGPITITEKMTATP